ncbi:DUF3046 domain-containing protein [Corynebacterium kutscheri]|uniref:DUF3046 domain-containing protein n=1 Tax=Corynebacterium kutscheri TaxID=35755 RepID=UPI0037C12895
MRLTEFQQLVDDEFGQAKGQWLLHSHVLSTHGATPDELIESGIDPRDVWWALCEEFQIPPECQLGRDD